MAQAQHMKGNMTVGSPAKALILFALPMILGAIFQQFYNIVDSIIVGNFVSESALAAVGASTAITQLFVMVANGTGIGASIIISNLFGAQSIDRMKSAISTALLTVLGFSIALSVVGVVAHKGILHLMGTPENVMTEAASYLAIYFYGFVFLFLYNAFSAIFNALGDSRKPLIFLIFSSLLNIGLDLLFVAKLGWGVPGVAWATLIAQGVSAVLSFLFLMRKLRRMESGPYARYDVGLLSRMVSVAVPTIVQQSIVSVGMLLIQVVVNKFGSSFLAGYTAATKLDSIAIVPMVMVGNAMSTYVAQNLGAKKPERIARGYHVCLLMAVAIGGGIAILTHLFCPQMIGWFLDAETSADAISTGVWYLNVVSTFYFLMGAMNCTSGVLRGAADMRWVLGSSIINLGMRVLLCFAFAVPTGGTMLMWSNPIGWGVCFCIVFARYKQGGWKKKLAE